MSLHPIASPPQLFVDVDYSQREDSERPFAPLPQQQQQEEEEANNSQSEYSFAPIPIFQHHQNQQQQWRREQDDDRDCCCQIVSAPGSGVELEVETELVELFSLGEIVTEHLGGANPNSQSGNAFMAYVE